MAEPIVMLVIFERDAPDHLTNRDKLDEITIELAPQRLAGY
jgi:hypothetical protein